jgi:hypothetical protein
VDLPFLQTKKQQHPLEEGVPPDFLAVCPFDFQLLLTDFSLHTASRTLFAPFPFVLFV